jgi:hypothetical protein
MNTNYANAIYTINYAMTPDNTGSVELNARWFADGSIIIEGSDLDYAKFVRGLHVALRGLVSISVNVVDHPKVCSAVALVFKDDEAYTDASVISNFLVSSLASQAPEPPIRLSGE